MKVVPFKPQLARRIVKRTPPSERLRGAIADIRECMSEKEVDRDDVLAVLARMSQIVSEWEAQT